MIQREMKYVTINATTFAEHLAQIMFDNIVISEGLKFEEVYEDINGDDNFFLKPEFNEQYEKIVNNIHAVINQHDKETEDITKPSIIQTLDIVKGNEDGIRNNRTGLESLFIKRNDPGESN